MWTTEKTRRAEISPRPLRVAYLIPLNPSHTLLDVIFDEAMSRWGGRRTPIVMTDGVMIREADWTFLDLWDADIIYSYVALQDELHDRIAHCLAPSVIEIHRTVDNPDDRYALRPTSSGLEWALKSTSVLPRIARHQEIGGEPTVDVLDKERGSDVERDLADSFGFLSNCIFDLGLTPYARRLSFRERGHEKFAPRFRNDDIISYISDIGELETRLSKAGRLIAPSQMSDMFCPYLNVLGDYRANWEEQLTVVIGDAVEDRLLFWSAIHHYKSLDIFRSSQVLRFSLARFQEGLPAWIEHLCGGARNSRHLNGNSAPNVRIISCSVSTDKLEDISKKISEDKHVMSSAYKIAISDIFETLTKKDPRHEYQHSSHLWPAWNWRSSQTTEIVRVEKGEIDLPCIKPWHTYDFPLGPATVGAWLSDLKIERSEDHSGHLNVIHHWMFPRRLALHGAVKIENYGSSWTPLRPPFRPTERGHLSLWDDPQWRRPTLRLPRDIDAFHHALVMHHPNTVAERASFERKAPYARIATVKLSDKGRDLLGVLKFFRNLNEAVAFLTNPYILTLISTLSPNDPAESSERISTLKEELASRLRNQQHNEDDFERTTTRVLELATRWVRKASKENESLSYAALWQRLKETARGPAKRNELDECIKFLRNQGFLLQGFGWNCARCQHPNWVGLTDIANTLECAICDSPEAAPVGGDSNCHFKLNPFVSAAFAPTSAQGSVIWCLSLLLEQAQHSFMLTPTLDIKNEIEIPQGTDLDVLACVDGKIHLYEVKKSFSGINEKQIDDLIKLAKLIRPDYAGFAIQNRTNAASLKENSIRSLNEELRRIDVKFMLMTGDENQHGFAFSDVPPNLGDEMRWNVW